jgi:hypothetical protein
VDACGKGLFCALIIRKTLKILKPEKYMKSVFKKFAAKKAVVVASVIIGAITVTTLPSCKHQEDCGAYQGSGKSTRSHKKHKRHSSVIRINTGNIA